MLPFQIGRIWIKGTFSHSRLAMSTTEPSIPARRNCLATSPNGLILRTAYEPPRQLHELGRAGLDSHSPDYSGLVRSKEIAGARPRNGSGGQGVSKSKGRIQRRTPQGRKV